MSRLENENVPGNQCLDDMIASFPPSGDGDSELLVVFAEGFHDLILDVDDAVRKVYDNRKLWEDSVMLDWKDQAVECMQDSTSSSAFGGREHQDNGQSSHPLEACTQDDTAATAKFESADGRLMDAGKLMQLSQGLQELLLKVDPALKERVQEWQGEPHRDRQNQ
jgi:hypothetical protein